MGAKETGTKRTVADISLQITAKAAKRADGHCRDWAIRSDGCGQAGTATNAGFLAADLLQEQPAFLSSMSGCTLLRLPLATGNLGVHLFGECGLWAQ
jgi:hypothetical protein